MKKFGLIFVLMIAVVGLFTGCDDKETEARLDEVTTALETMDVEKVYALCDDDTKANISQETIAERMSAVYDVLAVESIDYTDLKRNKDASSDGKTVYDALVKKFTYIQEEHVFFAAAFKYDSQNSLRQHDFELILDFYENLIREKTGANA